MQTSETINIKVRTLVSKFENADIEGHKMIDNK